MRELSLFTGAGGGIYGSKLLGWHTVGYVEWEDYPQRVIAQRIKDGIFDNAPIFTDVREFVQSGAARQYRGFVDVVTGGFPCQPFSVCGKRKASNDSRDMWPATMDVIRAVKPPVVFLENVPGLLSATVDDGTGRSIHYFGTVLRDLAEGGYDVKWCVLGAGDVGAPHYRKRLWILAYSNEFANGEQYFNEASRHDFYENGDVVANAKSKPSHGGNIELKYGESQTPQFRGCSCENHLADTQGYGLKQNKFNGRDQIQPQNWQKIVKVGGRSQGKFSHALCEKLERNQPEPEAKRHVRVRSRAWENEKQNVFQFAPKRSGWWESEPLLGRVANGVANRSHRLKAIGNGQVSLTMAAAYEILSRQFLS